VIFTSRLTSNQLQNNKITPQNIPFTRFMLIMSDWKKYGTGGYEETQYRKIQKRGLKTFRLSLL
jgi:hypothetical protein